jgi:NAD(P)H dehydrogenase (quinone)
MIRIVNVFLIIVTLINWRIPALHGQTDSDEHAVVLIAFYSLTGFTEKMAHSVEEGARSVPSIIVILKRVENVTQEDLVRADGIILGSPSYYANVAAPMKEFIDKWYFEYKLPFFDKIGGAFSTGGSRTGGQELVVISLLTAMMNNGMIVAGPLYEAWGTFGATAMTETAPHTGVDEYEMADARLLGERIARLALRMKKAGKVQ